MPRLQSRARQDLPQPVDAVDGDRGLQHEAEDRWASYANGAPPARGRQEQRDPAESDRRGKSRGPTGEHERRGPGWGHQGAREARGGRARCRSGRGTPPRPERYEA
jgi:hypothetical protein